MPTMIIIAEINVSSNKDNVCVYNVINKNI